MNQETEAPNGDRDAAAEPSTSAEPPSGSEPPVVTENTDAKAVHAERGGEPTGARSSARPTRHAKLRPLFATVGGAALTFLVMASNRHFSFAVPVGFVGCLIAGWGIFGLLGSLADPADQPRIGHRVTLRALVPHAVEVTLSSIALVVVLHLAVAGVLPAPIVTAALLVPLAFMGCVVAVFRLGRALGAFQRDEQGSERGLLQRHGFWLIALNVALYLPLLGSFSLSDPWETHYGEVAREMLARDDWISLWWAQDGWFWSKPVLDFWIQGLFFSLLGVRWQPDQVIEGVAHGRWPQPEWAARMPVFLLTLLSVYLLYKGVAKVFGRRAGLLAGVVLTTVPYWYFLSHQSMTDMPYVAPLTAACGLLLLGFHGEPDAEVRATEISVGCRRYTVSAYHLLLGSLILCVLPQILYLFTRNLTLQFEPFGFRPHLDEFFAGSGGGVCGLPGNERCRDVSPLTRWAQPALAAIFWSVLGGVLLWMTRGERRVQRLCFLGAWLMLALSALAKGAPGLVLPIFIVLVYIAATRRWRDLERLELPAMLLVVAAVVLPWYVQMYMRHGEQFTDRLLFHDMYKRAFVHVHDTNAGDDTSFRYYVWQLGYGLFPWTGLAAAGLIYSFSRGKEERVQASDGAAFLGLWFVAAFGMFTISLTKFHHYIFPAVPAIAALTGVLVDRWCPATALPKGKRLAIYLGMWSVSALLMVYGTLRLFPGSVLAAAGANGELLPAAPMLGSSALGGALIIGTVATLYGSRYRGEAPAANAHDGAMIGAVAIASALAVALVGRDLFTTLPGDVDGQVRLLHLFTYNYRRPWPTSLNFDAALIAFTVVSASVCAAIALPRFRAHAVALFGVVAVLCTIWGLNVYLFLTAPHWGQRETVLEYYKQRKSPEQPLVAYQMNWKGENFYTGNKIPAFVSSGDKFKTWLKEQRAAGIQVFFFTTEHSRIGTLKSEIGEHRKFELLTTKELNNKFFLARVEF